MNTQTPQIPSPELFGEAEKLPKPGTITDAGYSTVASSEQKAQPETLAPTMGDIPFDAAKMGGAIADAQVARLRERQEADQERQTKLRRGLSTVGNLPSVQQPSEDTPQAFSPRSHYNGLPTGKPRIKDMPVPESSQPQEAKHSRVNRAAKRLGGMVSGLLKRQKSEPQANVRPGVTATAQISTSGKKVSRTPGGTRMGLRGTERW